jgi:tetratricopeptide (TPR) repeat protein
MPMAEFFLPTQELVLVRFNRWDDILKLAEPDPAAAATHALWHFARGMAYAEKKNFYEADAERESLLKGLSTIPDDAMLNFNRTHDVLNLASHLLEGRIAMNRISIPAAIEHFRAAAKIEDSLRYDEPPAWFIPSREALGRALMTSSRFEEAEKAFREDLVHHPGNGRALFGLWQSLKEQGKKAEAKRAENDFKAAWKNADVKLALEDL